MNEIIECIPNFSEGRDKAVIEQLTSAIQNSPASLLGVESDASYNRTVITFAGDYSDVKETAFSVIKTASELIDMALHHGQHPRIGATDVCPLVPVSAQVEDCVRLAHDLGRQVGDELGITVYTYGDAALSEQRRQMSAIRKGEYEGLREKLEKPEWKPDYGPGEFNSRSGATLIGVRPIQIAYNVNLNTDDVSIAGKIAGRIRQSGRVVDGIRIAGSLTGVRAMGVLLESHGIAQISMNLDDLASTPLHIAYEEVCLQAEILGFRVTGSEVCGLLPESALIEAGQHQSDIPGVNSPLKNELIRLGINHLGLDQLYLFEPQQKVLEYALGIRGNE